MKVAFTIPGPPVPWQRKVNVGGRTLTPKRTRAYQKHARSCAQLAMMGAAPMTGPCIAKLKFYCQDLRRRDVDNLSKSVLDSANGVVFEDDSQVFDLHIVRALDRENPRAEIEVRSD